MLLSSLSFGRRKGRGKERVVAVMWSLDCVSVLIILDSMAISVFFLFILNCPEQLQGSWETETQSVFLKRKKSESVCISQGKLSQMVSPLILISCVVACQPSWLVFPSEKRREQDGALLDGLHWRASVDQSQVLSTQNFALQLTWGLGEAVT